MTKTKYKSKHKATSKNKGFKKALVGIGIIVAVSFIWVLATKLYTSNIKPDGDNSPDSSVIEPIYEEEDTINAIEEESKDEEIKQELPSNSMEIPQDVPPSEEPVIQPEEPSESRMQAPQSWEVDWLNNIVVFNIIYNKKDWC